MQAPSPEARRKNRAPITRLVLAAGLVLGASVVFYQNCGRAKPSGALTSTQAPLESTQPLERATVLGYQQWEGAARAIEIRLDHGERTVSLSATDASTGQPIACDQQQAAAVYAQLTELLSKIQLRAADPGLVCTANLRDSVELTFDDATAIHFSYNRCSGRSPSDDSLKTFVRTLCPPGP